MAAMGEQDRFRTWATLMRHLKKLGITMPAATKVQLRAFINETDDWIDTNQASYKTSLTAPFDGANAQFLTAAFCYVAMRRAGLLKAEED